MKYKYLLDLASQMKYFSGNIMYHQIWRRGNKMNPNDPRAYQRVRKSIPTSKVPKEDVRAGASSEECLDDQYQIILDHITDGVYALDLDWRITYFNRAAEKITGIPINEAIGRPCFEVFRSSVCESNCVLRETMDTGSPILNRPIYILRADKKRIPVSSTTALLRDRHNKTIGGVVTFRDLSDISELKRALLKQHSYEDIVSKSARMHKTFFNSAPDLPKSQHGIVRRGKWYGEGTRRPCDSQRQPV
jgi:PAS domain S-box-containing protein